MHSRPRTRPHPLLFGVVVAIALLLVPAVALAFVPTTGTISGHAYDQATGDGVSGVAVYASWTDGTGYHSLPMASSDATGFYSFLVPNGEGSFKLQLITPYPFYNQWWDRKPTEEDADPVVIAPGGSGVADVTLTSGSNIMGTVTGQGEGNLEGIQVTFTEWTSEGYGVTRGPVYTDDQGKYIQRRLPAGDYDVRFRDLEGDWLTEWSGNVHSASEAVRFPVGEDATAVQDAELEPAAKVDGHVTEAVGGAPVEDVEVQIFKRHDDRWYYEDDEQTDAEGYFKFGDLGDGRYALVAYPDDGLHAYEFYDDVVRVDELSDFAAAAPDTSTVDIALDAASKIAGRVTNAGGSPIAGIQVRVRERVDEYDGYSTYTRTGVTGADGNYEVGGLTRGGFHQVEFRDPSKTYAGEWYDDRPAQDFAHELVLPRAGTLPGVDAALAAGGSIGGACTKSAGGDPAATAEAYLYELSPHGSFWFREAASAQPDGSYLFDGLPANKYKLYAHDDAGILADEYWQDAPTESEAETITLTVGQDVTGRDFQLVEGATIGGTVIEESGGTPVEDVGATLYEHIVEEGYWNYITWDYTDAAGLYGFTGLGLGDYKVWFHKWDSGLADEWWNAKPALSTAETITIDSLPATVSSIDASLKAESKISGTVTGGGGPIEGAFVCAALVEDPVTYYQAFSDSLGRYSFQGLPAGDYKLSFSAGGGGIYAPEYHTDAYDWDSATPVALAAGENKTVDAELDPGFTISGTVTRPAGLLTVRWRRVDVGPELQDFGGRLYALSPTYSITGLAPGEYKLAFETDWLDEVWYDGKPTEADATTITVGPDATANTTIERPGDLLGTLTGPAGQIPENGRVRCYLYYDAGAAGLVEFDDMLVWDGDFEFRGLVPESYLLRFVDSEGVWPETWYANATDEAGSTPVDVVTDSTTFISASMGAGGTTASTLALNSSGRLPLAYGSTTTLTATLRGGGAALAGRTVEVLSGSGALITSLTTNSSGVASWTTPRLYSGKSYRFEFAGDGVFEGAASTVAITVRPSVGRPYAPGEVDRYRRFTTYGYLRPRHTRGRVSVTLYFYRYYRGGWHFAKAAGARNYDWPSISPTRTRYVLRTSLSTRGRWRVKAYHRDAGFGTYSASDYLTVR